MGPQLVNIKWDPSSNRYVMIGIKNEYTTNVQFVTRTSPDGITWTETAAGVAAPNWSAEFGFSGDDRGFMTGGKILLGFAAPYDLKGDLKCVDAKCELFVMPVDVTWR